MSAKPLEQIVGNRTLDHFDALVIGSGAGGSAVAAMLATHGQKVLVLEAGSNYFDGLDSHDPTKLKTRFSNDELKMVQRRLIMPDPRVEPRTFRRHAADGKRSFVGDVNHLPKTVGGGGVHADLKTPRFQPIDFQMRTLLGEIAGASFADWPITYDDLEPFYLWTERAMGVQGLDGSSPFDPPRSAPFPMAPGLGMYASLRAAEAAARLGLHPFPYPTAVNSQPYGDRPACNDCGFCGDFGCATNAKGSPAVTTLRRALLTGNCLLISETRATRLILSPAGNEVVGVEAIGPDGKKVIYQADRYVLSASPMENARLLFLSDPAYSESDPNSGVGNSSGLVGRNIMFHLQTLALGVFAERLHGHRGRAVTHGILDFRGVPGDQNRPMGGIVELGTAAEPISEAQTYAGDMRMRGKKLRSLLEQSPTRDRLMGLLLQAEDAPQLTNRVDLDPEIVDLDGLPVARLTYANHAYELHARDFYKPKLIDILIAAGAKAAFISPPESVPSSHHVMGTLRVGNDPRTSVCDVGGKFHDLGNLWAADGSLFPTGSGMNPTLTVAAMGARVGAAMIDPESPSRALALR